jgi:hypothetical protein
METLVAEALAKIKPTDPLRLSKEAERRNRNGLAKTYRHDERARRAHE